MKLAGKVAIISGASSGIGYTTALRYAQEGARVYAIARRADRLEGLVEEAKTSQGLVVAVSGDVSNQEDVDKLIKEVIDKEGKIDILINNAGVLDDYKSVENITDELWERVLDINVTGTMRMSRAVITHMRKQKSGVILNTASVGGLNGMRGGLAYVASKHAVVGMTKNIAYSYAQEGIRCVAVAPGSIGTEIGDKVKDPDKEMIQKLMGGFQLFPLVGEPTDIANAYVFLGSDEAKFINGTTLVIDGGWTSF